jgi:hypothetical protein
MQNTFTNKMRPLDALSLPKNEDGRRSAYCCRRQLKTEKSRYEPMCKTSCVQDETAQCKMYAEAERRMSQCVMRCDGDEKQEVVRNAKDQDEKLSRHRRRA